MRLGRHAGDPARWRRFLFREIAERWHLRPTLPTQDTRPTRSACRTRSRSAAIRSPVTRSPPTIRYTASGPTAPGRRRRQSTASRLTRCPRTSRIPPHGRRPSSSRSLTPGPSEPSPSCGAIAPCSIAINGSWPRPTCGSMRWRGRLPKPRHRSTSTNSSPCTGLRETMPTRCPTESPVAAAL